MNNFRTYNLAVEFYRISKTLPLTGALKEQLSRAAPSIALNLAEGRGRASSKDQGRFFQIALGSLRKCQTIFELADLQKTGAWGVLDNLGAHLYKLIKNKG